MMHDKIYNQGDAGGLSSKLLGSAVALHVCPFPQVGASTANLASIRSSSNSLAVALLAMGVVMAVEIRRLSSLAWP